MARIEHDSMHAAPPSLDGDERLVATFAPDLHTYWKSNAILAVIAAAGAGILLVALGNAYPWTGPLGALLAMAARAGYLKSEVFAEDWRMTSRRLLGPGGRIVPLSRVKEARKFMDAVQIITKSGDKHLIRYQADAVATVATILAARDNRR
jgi:hypothetical protein